MRVNGTHETQVHRQQLTRLTWDVDASVLQNSPVCGDTTVPATRLWESRSSNHARPPRAAMVKRVKYAKRVVS